MNDGTKRTGDRFGEARTLISAETAQIISGGAVNRPVENRVAHPCVHPHDFCSFSSIDRTASRTESCAGRDAQENSPARL